VVDTSANATLLLTPVRFFNRTCSYLPPEVRGGEGNITCAVSASDGTAELWQAPHYTQMNVIVGVGIIFPLLSFIVTVTIINIFIYCLLLALPPSQLGKACQRKVERKQRVGTACHSFLATHALFAHCQPATCLA